MKFLLVVFTLFSFVHSSSYIHLDLINKVNLKYGKFAKNRFIALDKLVKKLENETELEKVKQVNIFFNNVSYASDISVYGVTDYWATPSEFLGKDKGDCEDYVIAKYIALEKLKVPTSKIYLTYVRVKNYNQAHMVLTYFPTPKAQPYVLDNINKRMLEASKRKDITPVFHFSPNKLQNGEKTTAHKKWDALVKNIKGGKI